MIQDTFKDPDVSFFPDFKPYCISADGWCVSSVPSKPNEVVHSWFLWLFEKIERHFEGLFFCFAFLSIQNNEVPRGCLFCSGSSKETS